jgi:hypothetical protein
MYHDGGGKAEARKKHWRFIVIIDLNQHSQCPFVRRL